MTNRFFRARHAAGFTLLELVIVLGITGLIFGGLWGLISSGGSQLQAQTAAQQYRQVIEATRRLLSTGQDLGAFHPGSYNSNPDNVTPGTPGELLISTLTDPAVAQLSPNFAQQSGGNYFDAFGHQIRVAIQHMDAGSTKWRFVVYSTPVNGAPIIPDKVGAQIASLIGSEGGFIYSVLTEGCSNAGNFSHITCGSYSSFAFDLTANGFFGPSTVPPSIGRIATLSFTSDNSTVGAPWLMRIPAPPSTDFNTMSAPLDFRNSSLSLTMRGSPIFMNDGTLSVGSALSSTASPGKITMNGGVFSMGADAATTGGTTLNVAAANVTNVQNVTGGNGSFTFNNLQINSTNSVDIKPGALPNSVNILCGNAVSGVCPTTAPLFSINGLGRADTFQAQQFIYTSDMRLKENVRPISNALDKVLQLRGMNYQWRTNHVADVGLVAQDVEKVFPELVIKTGDGVKGIDYAKMVAPLVEAIRQLKDDNDALRAKLDALEAKSGKY